MYIPKHCEQTETTSGGSRNNVINMADCDAAKTMNLLWLYMCNINTLASAFYIIICRRIMTEYNGENNGK